MTDEPRPLTRCPLCGSSRIRRQRITMTLRNGVKVVDVPADCCAACGEQILDAPTVKGLDELRARQ